jgi:hypothetical protein
MKVTHSLAPAAQQKSPTMQDMKPGQIAIITRNAYCGRYILRTVNERGEIFITLDDGGTFEQSANHPVNILPPGTAVTIITD